MRAIKADSFNGNCQNGCLEYTINGKEYECCGEFFYNKKKDRIEHLHEGPRGGQYLVIW